LGRRIIDIKRRRKSELNDADYHHMRNVIGHVPRHTAQRPDQEIEDTRWRYSLMNWRHDEMR
jgi:hypothetical protein